MALIVPEKDLRHLLLNVTMPGRYVGGEFGIVKNYNKSNLNFGICFPDLYEIGMSNQAVKLMYRGLNKLNNVSCERVFAPAQDFEIQLKLNNIPLYTLESGIPLNELDILGFSIGYELSATNILAILETGNIPLLKNERTESDPIVIAGGPAITNPIPFGNFLDAVYLGEAENDFYTMMQQIALEKKRGTDRDGILQILIKSPFIWTNTKTKNVRRSIWQGFNTAILGDIPVSSINTVQDNGIIEIMRGCPNSCRFCHAASFYRPYRQKSIENILTEIDFLIKKCGYNELTLSSLSSGDYNNLDLLIKKLNSKYVKNNISFSLPSLRINSFTLPLLKELSKVRKSGLTFAIETPDELWRKGINKEIDPSKIIEILKEAKRMGWKLAKFYFMIGLPGTDRLTESDKISAYVDEIQKKTNIKLNVNVGTFIPKAHTPFQWAPQLKEFEAYKDMRDLKNYFKRNPNVKLSYHSPIVSYIEGMLSRGDERVGDIILKAYKKGARLDAWEEHFDMDIWKSVISSTDWDVEKETTRERNIDEKLPWDGISLGINKSYLKREYKKALEYKTTEICDDPCSHNCGVCKKETVIEKNNLKEEIGNGNNTFDILEDNIQASYTYLIEFSKQGKAIYLSHLNMVNVFSKSLRRSSVFLKYSQGFNPKPKMEFAHPLSLGISSDVEIMSISLITDIKASELKTKLNYNLPEGITVKRCYMLENNADKKKRKSLMSMYGGSHYIIRSLIKQTNIIFFNQFINYANLNVFPNLNISIIDEGIQVEIVNTGKKDSNIFFHIEKLIDRKIFNEKFSLQRIKLNGNIKNKSLLECLI